jgi:hypothetical protein
VLEGGFVAMACLFGAHASSPAGDLSFKVLPASEGNQIWVRPYVAPAFQFKLIAGKRPEGYVEGCKVSNVDTQYGDHIDRRLILDCANGVKLQLEHVDFEN